MKTLAAAFMLTLASAAALAQVGLPFPGPGTVHSAGGGAYTGPGDITTYTWFVSTARAYSSATRGNNAVQLCQPAGSNCVNVTSDATTGIVPNAPTVNGSACDNASHICTIQCMYNQLGVAADDLCRASPTNQQPLWKVSATGTHPCGQYTRSSPSLLVTVTGTSVTEPYLASAVSNRNTGQTANQNFIIGTNAANNVSLLHTTGANNVNLYAGSAFAVTLTDGNYGSIAAIFNGGSSYLNVNGTTNSGSSGGINPTATVVIGTDPSGANAHDGFICEAGFANGVSSTATADSVEANTKTFYGF